MNIAKNQLETPSLSGSCVLEKKAEIKQYLLNSCSSYESLFGLLNSDGAYYLRPEPLRHPLIFYYGHTATFYVNKLILGKFIKGRINERLEAICAVGVDEMSWDDLDSTHYDWPAVDEVRHYRNEVLELVCQLIDDMELTLPITQDSLAWIILMGAEHERIHLETSSVIMRMLPLPYLTSNEQWQTCEQTRQAPDNALLDVSGTLVELGKSESDHTYGWDNEYGKASIEVPDFKASKHLVSNQEYMAFVEAGGYQTSEYWTEEGQQWLTYKQPDMPRFWSKEDGAYYQRNLLNIMPLPLDWPVEVNYLEAKAFCNWKSKETGANVRLPSEPEWYVLRNNLPNSLNKPQSPQANINLEHFSSSCPVDMFAQGDFYDVTGNVWQWTESEIDAFEGFKVHPLYDDFSTPTFDGQHNLIKGGSWISTGNETIKSSRYAFRRHFFQHAGFRYIESKHPETPKISVNHFETNPDICQQLEAHYGQPKLVNQNYALAVANKVRDVIEHHKLKTDKLLDLGCSVGRSTFELSKVFTYLDGVDFSARLIQHGVRLQTEQGVRYALVDEGELLDYKEIKREPLDLPDGKNILFSQGDASNLKDIFNHYDVILVQHLIEQHYEPGAFFKTAHQRLNADGILIVVSDYRFDPANTDKAKWFGGIKVNGENVTGREGLEQLLSAHFDFVEQHELAQELTIDARNVAVSQKQMSVWRLK